jgi:Zn-dependent protease
MVFPRVHRPGIAGMYLIMGLGGTLLFFVSLLAHELAHSVVARVKGIPVDGITLFLFGGMAHTRMEAETPGDEFQIAASAR